MTKVHLLLATALVAAAPAVEPVDPVPNAAPPDSLMSPVDPRLVGFAAELAQDRPGLSARSWIVLPSREIWQALAHDRGIDRQRTRWAYARSLIGSARGQEAIGVLEVMLSDEPDLALVDDWQLAYGAALTLAQRPTPAIAALGTGGLPTNPEACAWRMRALADAGRAGEALPTVNCAAAAIQARRLTARPAFLLAAGRVTLEAGQPQHALQWLSSLPDSDSRANMLRGRALAALDQVAPARERLDRAVAAGDPATRTEAQLGEIELAAAHGWAKPPVLLRQLNQLRYTWRGDRIEARALRLAYDLATREHDLASMLDNGAALFRFFPATMTDATLLTDLQMQIAAAASPASPVPLDRAAGLIWDYRDLLPGGAEGDTIVNGLADRLQGAGLYERAAQLLEHRLDDPSIDLARGPLSAKVATLYILAGRPDRALSAIRNSERPDYTAAMQIDRRRVVAVALDLLGRTAEAEAVLQDVPDGAAIRAEFAWKRHDWARVVAETQGSLPTGPLGKVGQVVVLRRAIALAMLHNDAALAALRARYQAAFARLPSGPVFTAITQSPALVTPAVFAKAMAAMPSASPVGDIGDMIAGD